MKFSAIALTVVFLFLSGCANIKSWSYAPEPRVQAEPVSDLAVAVLPCEDHRHNRNSNRIALYMIPLFPFGWADFETPEGVQRHVTSGLWQFRPSDDFARAIAEEVENARIFREAFVSNRASEGDLVLLCKIRSTKYEGKILSYGLSVYGPLLWLIGLPAATASNQIEIELALAKNPSSPPIWSHVIRGQKSHTSWIYVMRPDFEYDVLLKEGIKEAMPSLKEAARQLGRSR